MRKERGVGRDLSQVGLFCLSGCIGECSQEQQLWGQESSNTGQGGGKILDFDSTWRNEIESRWSCYKFITNTNGESGSRMTFQNHLKLRHVAWVFTLPTPPLTSPAIWHGSSLERRCEWLWWNHSPSLERDSAERHHPSLQAAGGMSVSILKVLWDMGWPAQDFPHTSRVRT